MKFTYENAAGDEITITFPIKKAVCFDCNGEGKTLCPGMRGHAYSMEEFQDSFNEEEQAEYFKVGGRYDVTCETCHGRNVVDEIDESACERDSKLSEALSAYYAKEAEEADYQRLCQAERRMGA